jgi:putative transposase
MKEKINFDMESAIQALREGKDLNRKDGIFTPLIKQLTEAAMQAELEGHLATEESPNRTKSSSSLI